MHFSTTIEPLLTSLTSVLALDHLNDLTVGDRQFVVATDVQMVKYTGANMRLTLDVSKCELFCHPNTSVADPLLLSFTHRSLNDASLLGAPLFLGPELNRLADHKRAVEHLRLLGPQDALVLLQTSFSTPRVQHLMRCSSLVCPPTV